MAFRLQRHEPRRQARVPDEQPAQRCFESRVVELARHLEVPLREQNALLLAAEGASVVVNDLGGSPEGTGSDATPAEDVESYRAEVAAWDDIDRG